MKRSLTLLVATLCFIISIKAYNVDTISTYSHSMQKQIKACVITPQNYNENNEKLPVLYFLHGHSGNYKSFETMPLPNLMTLSDIYNMIIVCPDGGYNSWYINSPIVVTSKYETYISDEIIEWIDKNYKTIPKRVGRAITGLSMGGHGALFIAFRHQDKFGVCGSMSGGVDLRPFPYNWELERVLGKQLDFPENWGKYSVINQVERLYSDNLRIIIDCGIKDIFYDVNVNLHEKLLSYNIPHSFISNPGDHNIEYWNEAILFQGLFFSRYFIENSKKYPDLIPKSNFSTKIDGKQVSLYTLKNRQGMTAQITNFGGRVASLWVPDKNNDFRDIVTGFNSIGDYQKAKEVYFGALIGRYGNRIAKGEFTLDGKRYKLNKNNNGNHLHGGPKGFHNVVWNARPFKNINGEDALELSYLSKDGEEGYPGNLSATVLYTLTNDNELKIEYTATTDKPTVINLTHHSFFNLHGFSDGISKSIDSHILKINGSKYTPTDALLIPTGKIDSVKNTPMDFVKPTAIGKRVNDNFDALKNGKGYDHNWILDKHGNFLQEAAVIYEPETGIQMKVLTDQPALQFYGGNFFEGKDRGKYGEVYNYRTSFALETQHYPDSPNHPNFPTTILKPNETYKHVCVYKFEVTKQQITSNIK